LTVAPVLESDRANYPVFVLGCHRSGTNLLYDTLLSSGGFAIYRGLLPVFETLIPRFGTLKRRQNRERLLETWFRSKGFRCTGLDAGVLSSRILHECRSGGDFIRIVMESVAQEQHAQRWAVYDPDNVLHIERLKADIPNALFLHIIRDGRDIALSLRKMGGFNPLPWDRTDTPSLVATALYWEWMVRNGRKAGSVFPADYMEVHYENLIVNPCETLQTIGAFLKHDLNYQEIRKSGLGRLAQSNSSFLDENEVEKTSPVERWKQRLSPANVAAIEAAVGSCLEECGYSLSFPHDRRKLGIRGQFQRSLYWGYLNSKLWLKQKTPAGRWVNLSVLELEKESGKEFGSHL
jgi:hypothetical protein